MILQEANIVQEGPFSEMVELAKERAREAGGIVALHRPFEFDHVDDGDCPCNPLIISADNITHADTLREELVKCDG